MSDDLTVMGIAATAAAAMGREQIVLAHQAEHPLAGNPDVASYGRNAHCCAPPAQIRTWSLNHPAPTSGA